MCQGDLIAAQFQYSGACRWRTLCVPVMDEFPLVCSELHARDSLPCNSRNSLLFVTRDYNCNSLYQK